MNREISFANLEFETSSNSLNAKHGRRIPKKRVTDKDLSIETKKLIKRILIKSIFLNYSLEMMKTSKLSFSQQVI